MYEVFRLMLSHEKAGQKGLMLGLINKVMAT